MADAWHLSVFRNTKRRVSAHELRAGLVGAIRSGRTIEALVRAGEIECVLEDATHPHRTLAARMTDDLARSAVAGAPIDPAVGTLAAAIALPDDARLSPPEGFSYHAIHPLDYADACDSLRADVAHEVAVVGLRSIGTTLSAVAVAAFRRRGVRASRITVRPTGHPFDRVTNLEAASARWVKARASRETTFVIVDEGPGLSGSSLLSAAEAAVALGVSPDRIVVVCSRDFEPDTLRAQDAVRRWRYRFVVVQSLSRAPTGIAIDAGRWRQILLSPLEPWPATWPWMERVKILSSDRALLFKFEGIGRYGAEAARRARILADLGFSPAAHDHGDGFFEYEVVPGARPTGACVPVERLAEYCAARARAFAAPDASNELLAEATRSNARVELGVDVSPHLRLPIERPVVADGRMMPHEWIAPRPGDGALIKLDAIAHGDAQFFPGPTDIAWDLAGAMVEWRMTNAVATRFLDMYRKRSGDDARGRIAPYVFAYALFRACYVKLAQAACFDPTEAARCAAEHRRYRAQAFSSWMFRFGSTTSSFTTSSTPHTAAASSSMTRFARRSRT